MTPAGSEVWISEWNYPFGSPTDGVNRYDQSGNLLGQIAGAEMTHSMTTTGSEVRMSGLDFSPHSSWDLSGNLIGYSSPDDPRGSMVFVPEPNTSVLFSLGLIALAMRRRH